MNNIENKEKRKKIIIVLSILLICTLGFICNNFLRNGKTKEGESKCSTCEKCSTEGKTKNKICKLDMKGKTKLDVYDLCKEKGIDYASRVKIKNVSINNKTYVLFHDFEPFYDSNNNYVSSNSVTKLYLNGILLDAYKGEKRETLWTIKIDRNKLIVSETWPSEEPPVDHTYDLNNFKYYSYTYDLQDLM